MNPNPVKGDFAAVPGAQLWYLDTGGEGQPIVFLHANTGTSASWENEWAGQLSFFAGAGYRAIAFDRRGWGRSRAVPATGPQPGTIAGDLDGLLDFLHLGPVHLVAVAGGAFAAIDYVHWRPERVRSLVAGASTAQVVDDEIAGFSTRIRIPALGDAASEVLREVSAGYRGASPEGAAAWRERAEHARQADAVSQPLRTPNTFAKLAEIRVPTLVMVGSADLIAPPKLMELWAAKLPNHELTTIVGAGHSLAYEEPRQFNRLVHEFIQRQG
jgi:pimeloyl-ACP methyl ester carboxylesterase